MRRENWVALGLVLVIVGLLILSFSNTTVHEENCIPKASVDNSNKTSPEVSVSSHYEAGQRFFFNFTKGKYWGLKYDIENQGLEPTITDFSPNVSIPGHKIVSFALHTPSGDAISAEVYVVYGTDPFAVVYANQSIDFVPLEGGNLTFTNVGLEGTIGRSGNYIVKATTIVPLVHRDLDHTYGVATDPPTIMSLWNIEVVETKPYFVSSMSAGTILILSGAASSVWAVISKKRQSRHLRKTRR